MLIQFARVLGVFGVVGLCVLGQRQSNSQETLPILPNPGEAPKVAEAPETPKGVEVLARGPIHEAFAAPATTEAKPTPFVNKKPPAPLEEMAPEERPEGNMVWIGGYWAWDDERNDHLWVSGCWRAKPQDKEWVPGYWREERNGWQWAPGFWTAGQQKNVTYYPEPPAPPQIAPPGDPPQADMFFVPGHWHWAGTRYAWRAGHWTRIREGYVYVPSHYRWTPSGYVFVAGYWDYGMATRGVLYAPVTVDVVVVGPRFVYTPYYAVRDTLVLDALFIRPAHCHYYFGDYYGPRYRSIGFETCIVYSRRHYEPIIVYRTWEHRETRRWYDTQVNLVIARDAGRAPVPPRTLVQQQTIVKNNVTNVTNVTNVNNVTNVTNVTNVLAPTKTVVAARGQKTVAMSEAGRQQAKESAQAVQQAVVKERVKAEAPVTGKQDASKPRTAALNVPALAPTGGSAKDPGPKTPLASPAKDKDIKQPLTGKGPITTDKAPALPKVDQQPKLDPKGKDPLPKTVDPLPKGKTDPGKTNPKGKDPKGKSGASSSPMNPRVPPNPSLTPRPNTGPGQQPGDRKGEDGKKNDGKKKKGDSGDRSS